MYREQWTLSLVASTATTTTTTTATNHHNKNKPQKNNFLPKLTPADADLVRADCKSSYEGEVELQVDRTILNCVICGRTASQNLMFVIPGSISKMTD